MEVVHPLNGLLTQQLQQTLKSSKAGEIGITQALQAAQEQVAARLYSCIPFLQQCGDAVPSQAYDAPEEALTLAPLDDEYQQLQEKVGEVSQRLADYRACVPVVLEEKLATYLATCRPALETAAAEQPGGDAAPCSTTQRAPFSAEPSDHLRASFSHLITRMPSVRAKLEEALERLERIVGAVEASSTSPVGLPTTPASPAYPPVSPAFREALQSGKITTRRKVARECLAAVAFQAL
ncbi:hypothetical protein WJX72_002990 [[Myrmecia] bisecta]|uniref:Uncharacterized protein n=1 Tax=[Myrmecia] bisecta TaxID=41462 RepID=A0AAW1Q3Q8_9CHLO